MEFEKLKPFFEKAEQLEACVPQFSRAKAATSVDSLLEVIKDNIVWCLNSNLICAEDLLNNFGSEKLKEHGIYVTGEHQIESSKDVHLIFLGSSSATINTLGSSSATIKTWDSSSATYELQEGQGNLIKDLEQKKDLC